MRSDSSFSGIVKEESFPRKEGKTAAGSCAIPSEISSSLLKASPKRRPVLNKKPERTAMEKETQREALINIVILSAAKDLLPDRDPSLRSG